MQLTKKICLAVLENVLAFEHEIDLLSHLISMCSLLDEYIIFCFHHVFANPHNW